MSDTDDTDLLLLIPPDFFAVEKLTDDYNQDDEPGHLSKFNKQLSKNLISRVRTLESRIESLEINSSFDTSFVAHENRDKLSDSSTDNLSRSFSLPRAKKRKSKKTDISLNKPCDFNVDAVDGNSSTANFIAKSKEMEENDNKSNLSNDRHILKDIDNFLYKVESKNLVTLKDNTNNELKNDKKTKILDKYIYLTEKTSPKCYMDNSISTVHSNEVSPLKEFRCPDSKPSSNSPASRRLHFTGQRSTGLLETSTPNKNVRTDNKIVDGKLISRFKQVCLKGDYGAPSTEGSQGKADMTDTYTSMNDYDNAELLSLCDLWGPSAAVQRGSLHHDKRLEEEIMKRKHCEELIHQLQRAVLENEEKIAVAIKVDMAKDNALSKLREVNARLGQSLKEADGQLREIMDRTNSEKDKLKEIRMEAEQKSKYYENELYKALDLAHDYQDKYKQQLNEKQELRDVLSKEIDRLKDEVSERETEVLDIKRSNEAMLEASQQHVEIVQRLEEELLKEKETLREANKLLEQKRQQELSLINERDILKHKVNEERSRCDVLVTQIHDLQERLTASVKREESSENELKTLRRHIELQKNDLKSYYQKQLEEAVVTKMKTFQEQLDAAEQSMQHEIRGKEQQLHETYTNKIDKIMEQHKMEITLLEEKQVEESKLYRLQLAQANHKIQTLEGKLEKLIRRRGEIATQLHNVMEMQWRQAVGILMNSQCSNETTRTDIDSITTADLGSTNTSKHFEQQQLASYPSNTMLNGGGCLSDIRRDSNEYLSDCDLQHYIKMLLSKTTSQNLNSNKNKQECQQDNAVYDEPTSDKQESSQQSDRRQSMKSAHNKPPWKS